MDILEQLYVLGMHAITLTEVIKTVRNGLLSFKAEHEQTVQTSWVR
jgi:hypothetical protein